MDSLGALRISALFISAASISFLAFVLLYSLYRQTKHIDRSQMQEMLSGFLSQLKDEAQAVCEIREMLGSME